MLEPLYRHNVSLVRIDSRPSLLGERHIFIDILGIMSRSLPGCAAGIEKNQ